MMKLFLKTTQADRNHSVTRRRLLCAGISAVCLVAFKQSQAKDYTYNPFQDCVPLYSTKLKPVINFNQTSGPVTRISFDIMAKVRNKTRTEYKLWRNGRPSTIEYSVKVARNGDPSITSDLGWGQPIRFGRQTLDSGIRGGTEIPVSTANKFVLNFHRYGNWIVLLETKVTNSPCAAGEGHTQVTRYKFDFRPAQAGREPVRLSYRHNVGSSHARPPRQTTPSRRRTVSQL